MRHPDRRLLWNLESRVDVAAQRNTGHRRPQRNEPDFDVRGELYRILGVALTQVPGLRSTTVSIFVSAIGLSVERFATAKHFASCSPFARTIASRAAGSSRGPHATSKAAPPMLCA